MRLSHWLVLVGGGRPSLVEQARSDHAKFSSMGAVLVGTAAVAAASAAFALITALKLHWSVALVVGLIWGVIILNLDRMLVVSMARQNGIWRNVATAVPRLGLALVLGAVISMPLVLQIFKPEIDAELVQMRIENLQDRQKQLDNDPRFVALPDLTKRERELTEIAEGRALPSPENDARVVQLQGQIISKERDIGAAAPADQPTLRAERLDLVRQRGEALDIAKRGIAQGATAARADAAAQLPGVRSELRNLTDLKAFEEEASTRTQVASDGLVNRITALNRLTADGGTLAAARWALFALIASIEVLPVLAKLFLLVGGRSAYEKLQEQEDDDVVDRSLERSAVERERAAVVAERRRATEQATTELRRRRAEIREETVLALERDRASAQVEAGTRSNARLIERQEQIAARAIDVWADLAGKRTDDELAAWYRQHDRPAAPPSVPPTEATPVPPQQRYDGPQATAPEDARPGPRRRAADGDRRDRGVQTTAQETTSRAAEAMTLEEFNRLDAAEDSAPDADETDLPATALPAGPGLPAEPEQPTDRLPVVRRD